MAASWVDAEPGLRYLRWQAGRLFRRATRRPFLFAAGVAFVILAALGATARKTPAQRVKAVLRITETDRQRADRADWNNKALRGYVTEVAFSNAGLLELIERRRLFRSKDGRFEPTLALAELREMVEVDVVQNHIISLLEPGQRPRSAYVMITVTDTDVEDATVLALDLAKLVAQTGRNQRRDQARLEAKQVGAAVTEIRALQAQRRVEAGHLAETARTDPAAEAQLLAVQHALKIGQQRLDALESERIKLEARAASDTDLGGLEIEVLDPVIPPPPMARSQRLAVAGFGATFVALPLVALVLGALDRRVYTADDLRHLGLDCLARVRPGAAPK